MTFCKTQYCIIQCDNNVNIHKQPSIRWEDVLFPEWQIISRENVHMDPSDVSDATPSNFRARRDVMPGLFLELIKCFNSQESPRQGEAVFAQQSNFLQKTKASRENAERPAWKINATKFLWLVVPEAFQLEIPTCLCKEPSYPWDKAALWCSVTLRCSWRHSSGEQGRHFEGPQTIPGEDGRMWQIQGQRLEPKTGRERDFCTTRVNTPPPRPKTPKILPLNHKMFSCRDDRTFWKYNCTRLFTNSLTALVKIPCDPEKMREESLTTDINIICSKQAPMDGTTIMVRRMATFGNPKYRLQDKTIAHIFPEQLF